MDCYVECDQNASGKRSLLLACKWLHTVSKGHSFGRPRVTQAQHNHKESAKKIKMKKKIDALEHSVISPSKLCPTSPTPKNKTQKQSGERYHCWIYVANKINGHCLCDVCILSDSMFDSVCRTCNILQSRYQKETQVGILNKPNNPK